MDIESNPLIHPSKRVNHMVYWTRWYILTIACLCNTINNLQRNYWGPITESAKVVYDWSDTTLFVLINITNVAGFISVFLGCYLIDRKGIRLAVLICFGLLVLSAACKLFTTDSYLTTVLIGVGQVFTGFGTSITAATPAKIAETWFPLNERATATAIVALSAGLGGSTSFIVGPLAVSMPNMNESNILVNGTDVDHIREEIEQLNYAVFGVTVILFLIACVYFPIFTFLLQSP